MTTYKIHLIRHGLTDANLGGLYVGRTDVPLCGQGRRRLTQLREDCGYPQVQKVYTGPLARCVQTAGLLYPDAFTQVVEQLTEYDFGEFEGLPLARLKNDPRFDRWVASGLREAPPGGEESGAMEARICRGLEIVFEDMMRNKLGSAAVVTHGGVIAALMAKYAYPRREGPMDWMVENGCGYTILMTPQMWMRDQGFEAFEKLPYRVDAYLRLGPEEFRRQLAAWRQEQEPRCDQSGYEYEYDAEDEQNG